MNPWTQKPWTNPFTSNPFTSNPFTWTIPQDQNITFYPPDPTPNCIYGNLIYKDYYDNKECVDGKDNETGILRRHYYKEASNSPCNGDKITAERDVQLTYNCPCQWNGAYQPLPNISSIRSTLLYSNYQNNGTDNNPTTITGSKRSNGGKNCDPFIGPYISIKDNTIPIYKLNSKTTLLDTIKKSNATEGFTNSINDNISINTTKLNEFNNLYYSYVYKCLGDEKNQKEMVKILNSINNQNLSYEEIMKEGAKLQPSLSVSNNNSNNIDCDTLKKMLVFSINENKNNNPNYIGPFTSSTKYDDYKKTQKKIIDDYESLNVTRNDLDQKLRDLYNIPGYNSSNSKFETDSTVYTTLIATLLASSLLYFVFTKL